MRNISGSQNPDNSLMTKPMSLQNSFIAFELGDCIEFTYALNFMNEAMIKLLNVCGCYEQVLGIHMDCQKCLDNLQNSEN